MTEKIVRHDVQVLMDEWLESEQNGERFPVPFDAAWVIAGYSRKDNAKRKLTSKNSGLIEDQDFAFLSSAEWSQDGRSSDLIGMTCDAFKQFCLMAKTDEGRIARLYFIDAEKKLKAVLHHGRVKQEQSEIASVAASVIHAAYKPMVDSGLLKIELVVGMALNAAQTVCPALKPAIEDQHKFLAATTTIPDTLLTPTAIGERLGISAKAANIRLLNAGLQRHNPDKSKGAPAYLPTDRGHEFCHLTIATGKAKDSTSYQHLKWYPSVLSVIEG